MNAGCGSINFCDPLCSEAEPPERAREEALNLNTIAALIGGNWATSSAKQGPSIRFHVAISPHDCDTFSTPNMTGRRFHRTADMIPRRPWKAKAPLLPDLLKQA